MCCAKWLVFFLIVVLNGANCYLRKGVRRDVEPVAFVSKDVQIEGTAGTVLDGGQQQEPLAFVSKDVQIEGTAGTVLDGGQQQEPLAFHSRDIQIEGPAGTVLDGAQQQEPLAFVSKDVQIEGTAGTVLDGAQQQEPLAFVSKDVQIEGTAGTVLDGGQQQEPTVMTEEDRKGWIFETIFEATKKQEPTVTIKEDNQNGTFETLLEGTKKQKSIVTIEKGQKESFETVVNEPVKQEPIVAVDTNQINGTLGTPFIGIHKQEPIVAVDTNQINGTLGTPFIGIHKQEPIVTTEEGMLRGTVEKLFDGTEYYSFKGVPYAEAPVGNNRFRAPLPARPWRGIREASKHAPVCTQFDTTVEKYVEGSEDCLFLNIYTQSLDTTAKIPVMVYIHGGSYMSGSGNSDTYSPDLLVQHNVILVTLNYRLEVLGFLSLNNADVPGNAGMKDQVAALRWIQDNIEQFGGDVDSVTLFGESSGASAVTYHMLSPMSKGLFHKAIVQSGVCLEDWAQGRDSVTRAFRVAKVLGKDIKSRNKTELVKFLRQVSPLNLTNLTYKTLGDDEKHRGLPEHFVPVVEEAFHPGPEPFLSENPTDLLLQGKVNQVPLLIGYNSGEGLFMLDYQLQNLDNSNRYPSTFVPRSLAERLSEERIINFGRRIKRFYVGKRQLTRHDLDQLRDIQTDLNYAYNTHRFAYLYQSHVNESVYMYRFDYDTDLNIVKKFVGYTSLKGACHADDLFYLFYNNLNKKIIDGNSKLREIVYKVTRLWTNFAKKGRPTPDDSFGFTWSPYTAEGKEYLKLDETSSMDQYADRCRVDFWNKLYRDAGLPYMEKTTP